jgi:hypothetical protein
MNKSIIILSFIVLLTMSSSLAYTGRVSLNGLKAGTFSEDRIIDYQARCNIVRPATEYRLEKVWYNIGIYGRLSNGTITCFLPHRIEHKAVMQVEVITPAPNPIEPICHYDTVCDDPVCHQEKSCIKWNHSCRHHRCIKWSFENVCDDPVCHQVERCE